jgi:hypothetical protein
MREEFEKWARAEGRNCALSTRRPGEYLYTGLQLAWESWQAALASRERVRELEELKEKYHELLYQVGKVHAGETRHDTALRYLRQAETYQDNRAQQALSATAREVGE